MAAYRSNGTNAKKEENVKRTRIKSEEKYIHQDISE
jgi:hypothetical protein